eukprot:7438297-Karenia_brevis.AAC.1
MNRAHFLHVVRDGLRQAMWEQAAQRRSDMKGIEGGLDTEASRALLTTSKLPHYEAGVLRTILSGGIWTQDRACRANLSDTACCQYCTLGETEDHVHLWWKCPAWSGVRAQYPEATASYELDWPTCMKVCGLIPSSWQPLDTSVIDLTVEDDAIGVQAGGS